MITVAVIEANRMVRDNITVRLNELPDVSVLVAADAVAVELLQRIAPRIVLLNVGLADVDYLVDATRGRPEAGGFSVVVMDLLPQHDGIAQLVNAGVAGFILKDATFDEFVGTIRAVATGGSVLPERLIGRLFAQLAGSATADRTPACVDAVHLTPREVEVIALIAQGSSNKQIALRLAIAEHTVKTHVRNVMEKLSLNTRLQIAAYAHQRSA